MKKAYIRILCLSLAILFLFTGCSDKNKTQKKPAKDQTFLEDTVKTDKLELKITEFRFGRFLASTDNDEFLFPTNDTSKILPNGISFVAEEGFTYAMIAYKVKNISKDPIGFRSISQMKLDFDNGCLYSQELDGGGREPLYVRVDNSWKNIEDFEKEEMQIDKNLSYEFRTCIYVPTEVADQQNDLSLLVYTDNDKPAFTYKVR